MLIDAIPFRKRHHEFTPNFLQLAKTPFAPSPNDFGQSWDFGTLQQALRGRKLRQTSSYSGVGFVGHSRILKEDDHNQDPLTKDLLRLNVKLKIVEAFVVPGQSLPICVTCHKFALFGLIVR